MKRFIALLIAALLTVSLAGVLTAHAASANVSFSGPRNREIKAENSSPGDTLYLYYYYGQAGTIEGKQAAVVDADGYVTFTIYHCSSYFVSDSLIEGAAGGLTANRDDEIKALEDRAAALEAQLQEAQQQALSVDAAAPETPSSGQEAFGLSIEWFAAALLATALLTMLLTMVCCRAGLFKRGRHASTRTSSGE